MSGERDSGRWPQILDDLFLQAQRAVDRLARRLRVGAPPAASRRRLLIVQIDGLSGTVLGEALARGHMPVLRSLVEHGGYQLSPMMVGMPTSTPAFQMAVMYGIQPDIPGFHYHDKRRQTDIHFPRGGHAAFVEASQAGSRRGILRGGSVYGCAFTGGAEHDLFSFSRLTRPRAPGMLRLLSGFVLVAWVAAKCAALSAIEAVRTFGRLARHPRHPRSVCRWFKKKVALSVWTRQWFTFAVARDVYDGVPAIYVNYLDYDEAAHAFGPKSRQAFAGVRAIDRSLRQIRRAIRRVPEHRYDLYVLADHGQAACTPYSTLRGGRRFERDVFEAIHACAREAEPIDASSGTPAAATVAPRGAAVDTAMPSHPWEDVDLGFEPYLDEREAWEQGGVRVVSAGPNAFVYFLDTPEPLELGTIEARLPGLAAVLSKSPGVGFVLVRAKDGPVCFWRGQGHRLTDQDGGPFGSREDGAVVLRDLRTLMAMPSAGDLVVYGIGAPEGNVSFIDEMGAHAGPSPEELRTFIVAPSEVRAAASIDLPLQLYELFIRYQDVEDTPLTERERQPVAQTTLACVAGKAPRGTAPISDGFGSGGSVFRAERSGTALALPCPQ